MKKNILIVAALLAGMACYAQKENTEKAPPPPPPGEISEVPSPPVPNLPEVNLPEDYKAFLQRNPGVKRLGHMKGNKVRIELKSGETEVYDLDNKEEAAKLQARYGQLPVPPPPVAPPPPPKAKKKA